MNNNRIRTVFLLIALLAGFWTYGCGSDPAVTSNADCPAPRPEPPYDWADSDLEGRLEAALEGWTEDFGLYGAAAVVTTPGWLNWSAGTGVQDRETLEPFEIDTLARIASATKTHTSAVILQLVDEGLLTLDTTLAEFVPDYPNAANITVRHLLQHRSGIPEVQLVDGLFILTVLLKPEKWFTPREILKWTYMPIPMFHIYLGEFVPREPVAEPGEKYHYSQPGYFALGMMIEQLTGKDLADVYRERLFRPLGMSGSYLPGMDALLEPWGYTNLFGMLDEKIPSKDLVDSPNGLNSVAWAAGGIVSNAKSLVKFLSSMLDGCLCSEQGLAEATNWLEVDPGDIGGEEYGLGLSLQHYDGFTTVGHNGGLPGSGSVMQYIPELDVYVGAVTNTDSDGVAAPNLVERVKAALLNEPQ